MKVLFVYCGYENLGVEYLSAVLRQAGHQTALAFDPRLFDDHYTRAPLLSRHIDLYGEMLKTAEGAAPDLLAFSVVTEDYTWARRAARELKGRLGVPVVFGGVHVSAVPRRVMEDPFVDFAVVGEGEQAMLELVRCLEQGQEPAEVPNLLYRRGDQVMENPPGPLLEDLDSLPAPDKELFYSELPYLRRDYMTMTSRGCPHRCSYCFNSSMRRLYKGKGRWVRRRSVQGVMDELSRARARYPLKRIQFYDDVFTSDREWLEQFAGPYRREIGLPFWCSANPTSMDGGVAKLLADMGCWEVQMGVQTINHELRRGILRRPERVSQVRLAVEHLRDAGIKCVLDNISGIPGESEAHLVESLAFYNEVRPSRISDYYLRYYPGTDMVTTAQEMGVLDEARIRELEQGLGSESFALGGTSTGASQDGRLHFLLAVLLLLPAPLNRMILERKLYRFLPRNDAPVRIAMRLAEVFSKMDINAERYYGKYLHFLGRSIRGWVSTS